MHEYVKDATFYHIHRPEPYNPYTGQWKAGTTITTIKKEPNVWSKFWDIFGWQTDVTNGQGQMYVRAALDCFTQQPDEYQRQNYKEMLAAARNALDEECTFVREVIFEEVRVNYFPALPSRRTCIWLIEKHAVDYWWKTLGGDTKTIFEVTATGTLFRADQRHLVHDTMQHDFYRQKAFHYWTGTDGKNPREEEILFEGILQVKAQYKDLREFLAKGSENPEPAVDSLSST